MIRRCTILRPREGAPSLIAIHSLHHVSLVVQDLARAKAFYGDVLGLQELPRPPFDFDGAW